MFLAVLFGRAAGFFSCLVWFFRRAKFNNALIRCCIFFAVVLMMFWCLLGPICCVAFLLPVVLRDHACPNIAPGDLLCPCTPNFSSPLCHSTPTRPKQPMCGHLHPLCVHTYGYDYVRVCLRFCVCVACTVRVCMPVFGLAGAYMLVFCAF